MDVARVGTDVFRDVRKESNHVVVRCLFDLEYAFGIESRLVLDDGDRVGGNLAELGERLACEDFNLEPRGKLVVFCPDPPHFRKGVTFDHQSPFSSSDWAATRTGT